MNKDELSSMTVQQLKEKLKSEGLPVSGKKSELISRLITNSDSDNPTSSAVKAKAIAKTNPKAKSVKTSNSEGDLPFFQSIAANGIASVEIVRWEAVKYVAAVVMFFVMISALGSDSWYTGTHSNDIEEEFGGEKFSATETFEINYGLSEVEFNIKITGDMRFSDSLSFEYSDPTCNLAEDGEILCDKMSSAGTVMQISLWLSILVISALLIIAVARGFGQLQTGFVDDNHSKIQFWGWNACVLIPAIGVILYALMTFTYESDVFGGDGSFGLGSTWWMMFFLLAIFAAVIHNSKVMKLVEIIKEKLETK